MMRFALCIQQNISIHALVVFSVPRFTARPTLFLSSCCASCVFRGFCDVRLEIRLDRDAANRRTINDASCGCRVCCARQSDRIKMTVCEIISRKDSQFTQDNAREIVRARTRDSQLQHDVDFCSHLRADEPRKCGNFVADMRCKFQMAHVSVDTLLHEGCNCNEAASKMRGVGMIFFPGRRSLRVLCVSGE